MSFGKCSPYCQSTQSSLRTLSLPSKFLPCAFALSTGSYPALGNHWSVFCLYSLAFSRI